MHSSSLVTDYIWTKPNFVGKGRFLTGKTDEKTGKNPISYPKCLMLGKVFCEGLHKHDNIGTASRNRVLNERK